MKFPLPIPPWLPLSLLPGKKYQGPRVEYDSDGTAEPEQHRLFREALTPRPKNICDR
jgi:hypothetical protein